MNLGWATGHPSLVMTVAGVHPEMIGDGVNDAPAITMLFDCRQEVQMI